MSTTASQERKRKPTDLNPGTSPASKHIKVESGAMASSGVGDNNPAMSAAQHRAALQQLLNAQTEMAEDAKMKYLAGLVQLRTIVESKGAGTPEGLAAQTRYDAIVNRLKLAARHAQQQQQQQQQRPPYQGQAQGGAVAANTGTTMGGVLNPAAKQNWIVPANVPPQNAEQWRTEIQMKLSQVGQKMNLARSQIVMLQQSQSQAVTPEQQRDLQARIVEHTTQFNHFKEIINKFGAQQKVLAEQKLQQQQQQQTAQIQQQQQIMAQQQQQQQAQVQAQQNQMRVANQQQQQGQQGQQVAMQKPAQQGTVPEGHNPSQQQGMMNAGLQQQQQQANTINNGQQNPQNHPQQQQPLQSSNPMQQQRPQQQQPQPQQPQQQQQNPHIIANAQQQQQQQRIATPIQRANSPPNPDANRTTMSPAPQLQQQQQQPQQQQQQQQQQPQQNGQAQAPRPVLQPVPQPSTVGRSPAPPAAAGTPMAQPNSPAPRSGSVQPRPSTASGTPVPQQAPQPQRMQPASSASAASPTISSHPGQTLRDTAQGHRLHIPKSLTIATPQPIAMPPARPTLSGGMNSSGSQIMSTPAIIKQPAFEFDEAGMGLLSKRKLEELVKQIDPEERLDPDVEESILELVDEFIDNIATTACKMAKLRGSDTLDIKDIQIILERNWNIRIPGYAADEIRTVRKFNPAPGYHQKMAALAAQKQLNQTTGKGGD